MAVAAAAVMAGCSSTGTSAAPAPAAPANATPSVVALSGADSAADAANDENDIKSAAKRVGVPECKHLDTEIVPDTGSPADPPADGQFRVKLAFTNPGQKCVVRGFPGFRFDGEDGTSWDVVRTNEPKLDVVLEPGDRTTANLTYLASDEGTGWHVKSIAVTPPHTYDTRTFPWKEGAILKQDGATHPGTYISPVRAGR
ncbi:DUF4232 domain-containing protein [Amycolatopsis pithecellobii]|nr:DUF4232 domain-containing protein [Amycolatopsis pithecellobii]